MNTPTPNTMTLDEALGGAFSDTEPPRILHVRVINKNDFPITDMYDSVPYTFVPNMPVTIPVDAAAHIFGWWEGCDPAVMKRHCQKRFGWNTPEMQSANQHEEFYKRLELKPMLYRLVPMQVAEETPDLPPNKARLDKPVGQHRPL
jgi:hypothetical protein